MSFLLLGDGTLFHLWCLINKLNFIIQVMRFTEGERGARGSSVSFMKFADSCLSSFLASLIPAFALIITPDSLSYMSLV